MPMTNIRHHIFLLDAFCLMILCILLYASSLHGAFVYDDFQTIVKNPYIKDLKYIPDYFDPRHTEMWSFHQAQRQLYRPILLTSFAFNYYLSRLDSFSYHLVNLILHIINTLLVYKAVQNIVRLLGPFQNSNPPNLRGIALMTALLFASHPIQTEAVSYIVSRSSLLSTFFILCSFSSFLLAIEENKRIKHLYKIISLLCFMLGLLTKEITIVVPLLVLVFSILYVTSFQDNRGRHGFIRISSPYFIILIIYLLPRIFLFGKDNLLAKKDIFICYFTTALKAVFIYLKLLILPVWQTVDHFLSVVKSPWDPTLILALGGMLAFVWLLIAKVFPYSKTLFFYVVWFAIALMPTLILPTMEPISEHTVYLPSIGFFAAISFLLITLWNRYEGILNRPIKIVCIGLFSVLIMQLGFLTLNRNLVWQNNLLLWKDAVIKAPQKVRPHQNLGNAYLDAGQLDLAIQEFQTVLSLDPSNANALNNLGIVWAQMGNYEKAVKSFNDSIALEPFNPNYVNNLGFLFITQGCFEAAIPILEKALRINPDNYIAYANLGLAYLETNNRFRGCNCLELSVKLNPDYERGVELYRKFCAKKKTVKIQ